MLAYKTKDLEVEDKSSYAFTMAPTHPLQSITASAIRFFSHDTSQTQLQAQSTDVSHTGDDKSREVLEGLCRELDSYLDEPRMPHIRCTPQEGSQTNPATTAGSQPADPEVCDPLRYWKVCMPPPLPLDIPHLCIGY